MQNTHSSSVNTKAQSSSVNEKIDKVIVSTTALAAAALAHAILAAPGLTLNETITAHLAALAMAAGVVAPAAAGAVPSVAVAAADVSDAAAAAVFCCKSGS